MEKYIEIAKKKEAETAVVISPDEIVFDRRAMRNLGLPCAPLQSKTEIPNRYAFVLIA